MNDLNKLAAHPLQTFQWADFREKTGVKVIRNPFIITIHKIPKTPFTVGYIPKSSVPGSEQITELKKIGKENNCIFIQLEPNVIIDRHSGESEGRLQNQRDSGQARMTDLGLVLAAHPLFTKYTFVLDLTKSEEELLKNLHSKTRYNIRVAQKHGVEVIKDNSDNAFKEYLKLTKETTSRQGFFAHDETYHRLMWESLKTQNSKLPLRPHRREACSEASKTQNSDKLTAHLFLAKYQNQTLVAWIVFVFKETLYYPYGASSLEYRKVMASNLMMWEVIKFGKQLGLKKFDMWGALGPNPDPKDPWYGFHRFKMGYGPKLVEFVGSYDLVINPVLYQFYKIADKIRWFVLKLKK